MARRTGKPRDPAKERAWRRTIAEHARSGLSIAAFCRREGLTPHTYRWWRQELARRDRPGTSDKADRAPSPSTELTIRSAFLPVRVMLDVPEPAPEWAPIEIVLPAGPTVRVTRGFDLSTLEAVLSVLEGRRC
jgi:transposase-like protein